MSEQLILPLKDSFDVPSVGGKATALAKLTSAGFKVPDGFVITTASYKKDIEKEILGAFDSLKSQYVAVRSSAAAEDGSKDAWAGQLDTFLNVTREDLMKYVKKCWQSAESERAKSYATQKNIKVGKIAVIVQAMVQSEVSGIAFSVNPISRNDAEMIIEAGFGLNEPIVSGEITPDTYVITKNTSEISQKHISSQDKKLHVGPSGQNVWQKVDKPDSQKLSDDQILEVSKMVHKLETFFEFPVDVEWTFEDGQLFILQSRPITTLG